MITMKRLTPLLALGGALVLAAPASAATSLAGGISTGNGNSANVSGILTQSFSVPATPAQVQLSIGAPLSDNGGRYAATAEVVGRGSEGYIGGGVGVGQLKQNGSSGTVFVGILGKKVAPATAVELRVYGSGQSTVGSSAFLGLRVGL